MDEDKAIKRKRILRCISKIITYTMLVFLMIIASFMVYYIISVNIANKKGEKAPFGLYTIVSQSMEPNINKYDVVLIKNVSSSSLKVGDVITFKSSNPLFGTTPITHRIVEIVSDNDGNISYRVKGDNNATYDDDMVSPSNIYGKVILRFPKLGKIKYILTSKKGWILIALLPVSIIIIYDIYKIIRLIKLKKELNQIQQ